MARRCALVGALALVVWALGTAAREGARGDDEVSLVQLSALPAREGRAARLQRQAEELGQQLRALLAQRRGMRERLSGTPVSLLAVNAATGSASKWYEMDDSLLLQKLHDRMKANEEKEQEEIANAQAISENGAPAGAAFLGQGASSPTSLRRMDAAHWLTQADMDHYAEDERRLMQLSGELQRVAASIARISSHQRDVGMHLGLPDPTTMKFELGDKVELQVGEGKKAGRWVKATVIGEGDKPNTWNVHIPSVKKGSKDMANVPALALRKDEDAGVKVVSEPSEAKYEVNEQAQIQIAVGPLSGQWVKCTIISKADLPDAYNVHVPGAPPGHRDIPSVPARVLRKAQSKELFSQYDMDKDGLLNNEEFKVAMREKATAVYREKEKTALYEEGEEVEVLSRQGKTAGMWVNCTIMGQGDLANSWNIFLPDAQPGFQYVQNMASERIRRIGEFRTIAEAAGHAIRVISPKADHEVLMYEGQYKGRWLPCELRKRSDAGDSFTIWVPFGLPDGKTVLPNVLGENIRPRSVCGEGYEDIFDADSPGYDHYDRPFNRKETAGDCAADCSKRFSCGSFEWSPQVKECHLNKVVDPSLPGNGDYIFCRRKDVPTSAAAFWQGPLIGQELEYLMMVGEYNGTWHPCKVTGFGQKADMYDVLASVDFLGQPEKWANWTGIPAAYLRFGEGRPLPVLEGNWEPPQGAEALFVRPAEGSAAQLTEEAPAGAAQPAGEADAAAPGADAVEPPAAPSDEAAVPPAAGAAEAAQPAGAEVEPAAVEAAASEQEAAQLAGEAAGQAVELAAATQEAEEDISGLGDLGQDLPEGVFRAGQAAEVKQAGVWVRCRVLGPGPLSGTYDVRPLSEPEGDGGGALRNIPAIAMRKVVPASRQGPALPGAAAIEVGGIDGEVGESVELMALIGPRAGQWVPGVIKGHGSVPDTYDVKVPSIDGNTSTLFHDIKGSVLRKSDKKVVLEEVDWPVYSVGERAAVVMQMGSGAPIAYSCKIVARGAARNTYDLEVPSFGPYPAAHARSLQKLSPEAAAKAAAMDDQVAVSLKAAMDLLSGMKVDLLPAFRMMEDRKDLRTWLQRMEDVEGSCGEEDRRGMAARLQGLAQMSPDAVAASMPEECSLSAWTRSKSGGLSWDSVRTCFQRAANTSQACAACPVKFLMSAASQCVPKCSPLMGLCSEDSAGKFSGMCHGAVGRCLHCLEGPLDNLMDCAEMPSRMNVLDAIGLMVRNSRGNKDLQIEAALRDSMDVPTLLSMDKFARQALRGILLSWNTFVSRKGI